MTTYSLHPGAVKTELQRHVDDRHFRGFNILTNAFASLFFKTPEGGAQTSIYCSVDEKLANETGLYYSDCREKTPSSKARNPEAAKRLWELSAKMVGIGDWNPITAVDNTQPS